MPAVAASVTVVACILAMQMRRSCNHAVGRHESFNMFEFGLNTTLAPGLPTTTIYDGLNKSLPPNLHNDDGQDV